MTGGETADDTEKQSKVWFNQVRKMWIPLEKQTTKYDE